MTTLTATRTTTIDDTAWDDITRAINGDLNPDDIDETILLAIAQDLAAGGKHVRDAILVTAIDPDINAQEAADMARHPHTPGNARLTKDAIIGAWRHGTADTDRARRAIRLISRIGRRANAKAPALAMRACLEWFALGDPSTAASDALVALAIDPDIRLAVLVLAAAEHGIGPQAA
ncbi:hypothetical protein Uis1B_2205 [Bifidobacterium margollesii]|uniref:Uncharacterized protein n=1 Tax=Bifidobacterium margollesii TaxID=2020964 RepID=A0A2N5J6Y0_9BIFI|nr:hypothetical protein [Bifidobacterium margollesii]PLS29937.1 hypothetical protein Uis1B_2205 [Bifidobacterium margollesii]